jgi:hypothetical protein
VLLENVVAVTVGVAAGVVQDGRFLLIDWSVGIGGQVFLARNLANEPRTTSPCGPTGASTAVVVAVSLKPSALSTRAPPPHCATRSLSRSTVGPLRPPLCMA